MAWTDIHVDDFGWVGKLRAVQDDAAIDISTYSTLQFIVAKPDGTTLAAKTASFTTDGTDGYLQYQFLDGEIDTAGNWSVQLRIAKAGVELTSQALDFTVESRLD